MRVTMHARTRVWGDLTAVSSIGRVFLATLLSAWLVGCASPRTVALQLVADQLASGAGHGEDDVEWVRDSAPALLKLAESLLRQVPGHVALAREVASGYTQYAYAFVAFEAEKLQSVDAQRAHDMRRRAAGLYRRARVHAQEALNRAHPGWMDSPADRAADLSRWSEEERVLAYWLTASWAASISLTKEDPEAVAELPRVVALARAVDNYAPMILKSQAAGLLGTLEASRPGGSLPAAERIFQRALAGSSDHPSATLVSMAESLAEPAGDRARFETLLKQALAAKVAKPDLTSQVMLRRARWLLLTIDERF